MTHPYTSQPDEDKPKGFSYEPGSIAPVTGAPYPEGFSTPAARPSRPGQITAAIVLMWVLSGLTVLFALLLGFLVLLAAVAPVREGEQAGDVIVTPRSVVVTGILAVLLLLVFAALMMVSAIRLPKRADSARVLALTLMGFFVFANISFIVVTIGGLTGGGRVLVESVLGILLSVLAAAMPGVVIVLLSLKRSVTWFYGKTSDAG